MPSNDVATRGYAIVNASLSKSFGHGESTGLVYLKLDNLGNELAFSVSTIGPVRPMTARAVSAGVRLSF